MKRTLICLIAIFLLSALAGCSGNRPTGDTTDSLPTTAASPTADPTPAPTSAPLTFQDLLDKSMSQEVVLNTYSLIDPSMCSYGYPAYSHTISLENGKARLTVEIPEIETKEIVFDSISHIDSYDAEYNSYLLADIEALSSYPTKDLYREWCEYRDLLDKVGDAYVLSLNNAYDMTGRGTLLSKLIIWQQDSTFYVLFVDPTELTMGVRSGSYEDDTFANPQVDWDFMDLVETSHKNPITIKESEYIQNPGISSLHYIDFGIENGVCSLGENELSLAHTDNFQFVFESSIYHGAHFEALEESKGIAVSQYKQRLMQHLESSHECYITENETLAIYQVGDTLYLLSLYKSDSGVNTCRFIWQFADIQ